LPYQSPPRDERHHPTRGRCCFRSRSQHRWYARFFGRPPGEFRRTRILELEDVVVLYAVALTIERGGLLRLSEPDRRLSRISDVVASLGRLRRNQLIEAERDGNAWRVSWGKRALDIAREAGDSIATE